MAVSRTWFASAPNRLEALSDGVFAIVLTLLVLELRIPDHRVEEGFLTVVLDNSDVLESYLVSFFVVGVLWRLQHMTGDFAPRGTPYHNTLTMAFLATVTLAPWSLSNLTRFPDDPAAVMAFSGILLASWLLLIAILTQALGVAEDERVAGIRRARLGLLGGPAAAALSIAVAPVSTSAALYVWLLLIPYGYLARRWPAPPADEAAGPPSA